MNIYSFFVLIYGLVLMIYLSFSELSIVVFLFCLFLFHLIAWKALVGLSVSFLRDMLLLFGFLIVNYFYDNA